MSGGRSLPGIQLFRRLHAVVARLDVQSAPVFRSLEFQSNTDTLVGIGNRRWLLGKAQSLLTPPSNYWAPTTVAIIDLDSFKTINDTARHAAGDDVLKQVGEILVAHSRPTDLVGRLGGDEDLDDTMARADNALYAAKSVGRNQIRIVSEGSAALI